MSTPKKNSSKKDKGFSRKRAREIFDKSRMKITPGNRAFFLEQMKQFGRGEDA